MIVTNAGILRRIHSRYLFLFDAYTKGFLSIRGFSLDPERKVFVHLRVPLAINLWKLQLFTTMEGK